MMKYKAILFDMDGTLVPMIMEEFVNGYFRLLYQALKPLGIAPEVYLKAVKSGAEAIIRNNGSKTNGQVFFETFEKITEIKQKHLEPLCRDFYENGYEEVKKFTKDNPMAVSAVKLARKAAPAVVLATSPVFPMAAQKARMGWVGLKPEDFDLVTSYETDSYCKPNPLYYLSVCKRIGVSPSECLMIGNDEKEDMYASSEAGLDGYLVTDWMIPCKEHPWNGKRGTFADLLSFLSALEC